MNGFGAGGSGGLASRGAVVLLLMIALVFTTTGLSCGDIPFATSTFRDASMDGIHTGVEGIINGILDGIFAVIEGAGDGGSTSSTSST